jgi:hypothetical protein
MRPHSGMPMYEMRILIASDRLLVSLVPGLAVRRVAGRFGGLASLPIEGRDLHLSDAARATEGRPGWRRRMVGDIGSGCSGRQLIATCSGERSQGSSQIGSACYARARTRRVCWAGPAHSARDSHQRRLEVPGVGRASVRRRSAESRVRNDTCHHVEDARRRRKSSPRRR